MAKVKDFIEYLKELDPEFDVDILMEATESDCYSMKYGYQRLSLKNCKHLQPIGNTLFIGDYND